MNVGQRACQWLLVTISMGAALAAGGGCQETGNIHDEDVTSLAFSPNGQLLAIGHRNLLLQIVDPTTGSVAKELQARSSEYTLMGVTGLSFSPDGSLLASALNNSACVWNVPGYQTKYSAKEAIYTVAFSPDGRFLALGGSANRKKQWGAAVMFRDVGVWSLRRTLWTGQHGTVRSMSFGPARLLITGNDVYDDKEQMLMLRTVFRSWDWVSDHQQWEVEEKTDVTPVVAASPKTWASIHSADRAIISRDLRTGKLLPKMDMQGDGPETTATSSAPRRSPGECPGRLVPSLTRPTQRWQ